MHKMKIVKTEKDACNGFYCASALRKGNTPNPGEYPHTCPYAEKAGGDEQDPCNCCSRCERECAMDFL